MYPIMNTVGKQLCEFIKSYEAKSDFEARQVKNVEFFQLKTFLIDFFCLFKVVASFLNAKCVEM